jgi:hypothetical protein
VGRSPPGGLGGPSRVNAVDGGQQAGYADVGGVTHASLWSGTAASWVDLHPAGATDVQCVMPSAAGSRWGAPLWAGCDRASLWSGTAASWVDLHGLPAGRTSGPARARGISSDGVNTVRRGLWLQHRLRQPKRSPALDPASPPVICPADLDNDGDFANGLTRDGAVTIEDLLSFLVGFEAGNVLVDLDNGTSTGTPDNAVDINDLLFFLARFEAGC